MKTQNLYEPIQRDRWSRSTPPSAQPTGITWTDQTDPAHQEEQSPSEVLSIGATRGRPSLDRPLLRRARMAGLGLLTVAGAVLCIKAWPSSAPTALTADTQPPRHPKSSQHAPRTPAPSNPGAPTALAQALHAALPHQQTYIALTTRDSHTGRVHRIHIDVTLPDHTWLRIIIDRPIQQIATPTPWSFDRRWGFSLAQPRQSAAHSRQRLCSGHRSRRFDQRGRAPANCQQRLPNTSPKPPLEPRPPSPGNKPRSAVRRLVALAAAAAITVCG